MNLIHHRRRVQEIIQVNFIPSASLRRVSLQLFGVSELPTLRPLSSHRPIRSDLLRSHHTFIKVVLVLLNLSDTHIKHCLISIVILIVLLLNTDVVSLILESNLVIVKIVTGL
jgi:hypothetical protein